MNKIAKKTIIVYILKILYCYSSFDYPVTQTYIANYLNDIDIPCDRKTVGRNINYLIEMGLPIVKGKRFQNCKSAFVNFTYFSSYNITNFYRC